MRALPRWRARVHDIGEQWRTWRQQWAVEREVERAVDGAGPILAGPWLSEVGYEVLYWVPFLRWVKAAYRIPDRSEEHTSELQSQSNLVCRLLLEKKKKPLYKSN